MWTMDVATGTPLQISVAGQPGKLPGVLIQSAGRRLRAFSGHCLPPGTAVVIEMADALLFGEVSACENGEIAVELDQAILAAAEVARLAHALLG